MTGRHLLDCDKAQLEINRIMNGGLHGQSRSPDKSILAIVTSAFSTICVICLVAIAAILTCFGPAIKMVLSAYILAQL